MAVRATRVIGGLVAAALLAVSLTACAGDDEGLLPGEDAQEIIANLERVEELAAGGSCDEAEAAIDDVESQVTSLPGFVSDRLRDNLMTGVSRLREVVAENCPDRDLALDEEPDVTEPPDGEAADGNGGGGDDRNANADRPQREGNEGERPGADGGGDRPQADPQEPNPGGGGDADAPRPEPQTPAPDESGGVTPGETGTPDEGGP